MALIKDKQVEPQPGDTAFFKGALYRCAPPEKAGSCNGCVFVFSPCIELRCREVIYKLLPEDEAPEAYSLLRLQGIL